MKRLKPVSFKATFVDRRGSRRQDISLSLENIGDVSEVARADCTSGKPPVSSVHDYRVTDFDVSDDSHLHSAVSIHERRRIQEQIRWNELRDLLVDSTIEESHLSATTCVWCHKSTAVVKCSYCGPQTLLCLECARSLHSNINTFHVLELWKVQ